MVNLKKNSDLLCCTVVKKNVIIHIANEIFMVYGNDAAKF